MMIRQGKSSACSDHCQPRRSFRGEEIDARLAMTHHVRGYVRLEEVERGEPRDKARPNTLYGEGHDDDVGDAIV